MVGMLDTKKVRVLLEARCALLQEQISALISSPLEVYKRFVSMTLRPLSLTVTKTSPGPYQVRILSHVFLEIIYLRIVFVRC